MWFQQWSPYQSLAMFTSIHSASKHRLTQSHQWTISIARTDQQEYSLIPMLSQTTYENLSRTKRKGERACNSSMALLRNINRNFYFDSKSTCKANFHHNSSAQKDSASFTSIEVTHSCYIWCLPIKVYLLSQSRSWEKELWFIQNSVFHNIFGRRLYIWSSCVCNV